MGHKIFLDIKIGFSTKEMSKLVGDNELISGSTAIFTISIKNLNDDNFPGGKMSLLRIKNGNFDKPDFFSTHALNDVIVPSLKPKELTHIYTWVANISGVGQKWLECKITASDDSKISYFQTDSELVSLGSDSWYDSYYAIDKVQVRILNELIKLRKDIKKLK